MARVIMDGETFRSTLDRLASEVVEHTRGARGEDRARGGSTRGVPLSRRLTESIEEKSGKAPIF